MTEFQDRVFAEVGTVLDPLSTHVITRRVYATKRTNRGQVAAVSRALNQLFVDEKVYATLDSWGQFDVVKWYPR